MFGICKRRGWRCALPHDDNDELQPANLLPAILRPMGLFFFGDS
jgi:hypothetical protein